jgi:CheY-like chemotaxis protein
MEIFKKDKPALIADDDPNDLVLLGEALKRIPFPLHFNFVQDGTQVLDYLRATGAFQDRAKYPFPSILFLDLKMPKMSGMEVLDWINRHPEARVVPTIIVSSSGMQEDVKKAYELGVNSYLVKPTSFPELARLMNVAVEFWANCAIPEMPSQTVIKA